MQVILVCAVKGQGCQEWKVCAGFGTKFTVLGTKFTVLVVESWAWVLENSRARDRRKGRFSETGSKGEERTKAGGKSGLEKDSRVWYRIVGGVHREDEALLRNRKEGQSSRTSPEQVGEGGVQQ